MTIHWSLVKTDETPSRQFNGHAINEGMTAQNRPFAEIAHRIKWHRSLMGLDQKTYAAKAGITRSSLNNWESGDYRLSLDGGLALRRTFGLSLDFMYEGIDDALPMSLRQAWRESPDERHSK